MNVESMPGRGRGGRGAPFGNTSRKELRRPINTVSPTPPKSETSEEDITDQFQNINIATSEGRFNINASEFVPKFGLSITASEFVPQREEGNNSGPAAAVQGNTQQMEEANPSVDILYDAMYQLTMEPGRFDSIARKLTEDLNSVVSNYETMESLAEVILENGISEPNFRYTGARLADYLSLHLTIIIEGATLRQILMQKCNREFKSRERMLGENPDRLRGFVLFLAELFQQLEIQVDAVVQRVQVLGDAIPQLIVTLGTNPSKDNVKCIVQTMKCCGSVLEEEERSKPTNHGTTPSLDKLFEYLTELSRKDLEAGLGDMLNSLIKLRSSNWGHSPPSSTPTQTDLPGVGSFQLDPVFYAPDGQVLTMEEYNFLQEYGVGDEEGFGDIQWSTGEDNPGMGEELEDAYEEFLRQQS